MTDTEIPYQQEYVDYLEIECGNQPRSIEGYLIDLRIFFGYLREGHFRSGEIDPCRVRDEHLRAFLTYLDEERGNGPWARNRKVAVLRNYYNFLVLQGRMKFKDNPARRIKKAPVPQNLPVLLSIPEAEALITASRMDVTLPYRNHAIIRLFLQTGLRLSELVQLEREDINLQEGYVRVRGKGDRQRLLPLTAATAEALREHLERMLYTLRPSEKVFRNHHGHPLTGRGVQMLFSRICKQAGLARPGLSPHKLRHTCLTLLMREGVDLMTLKELAGHQDISSTEIYAHMNLEDVRDAVDKHPLG